MVVALRPSLQTLDKQAFLPENSLVWHKTSVWRGKTCVLKDLSLTVHRGSSWAVTGPNGSGKTTLLESLVFPDMHRLSGFFSYGPFRPYAISYLAQKSRIQRNFPLSVYQLVSGGLWREVGAFKSLKPHHHHRILDAINQVGLADYAYEGIARLSGGQFQRARFARMILQDCPLVLLDEPFSGLDHATTQHLIGVLKDMGHQGKTVLVVLHDVTMIQAYGTNVLSLGDSSLKNDSVSRYQDNNRGVCG